MLEAKPCMRNPVISLSRIMGMIFIVLCHIIKHYSFIPGHDYLGQFFNCGVMLFLFISGYLYGGKTIQSFSRWYAKRIITVAVPAVIVSAITIIVLIISGDSVPVPSVIAYLLDAEGLLFISWTFFSKLFQEIASLGPLWFTTVIMLCYLLVPFLQKATSKTRRLTLFTILVAVIGSAIVILLSDYISLFSFLCFSLGYCFGKANALDLFYSASRRTQVQLFLIYTVIFAAMQFGRILLHKYFNNSFLYLRYASFSQFVSGTWFVLLFAFVYTQFPSILVKCSSSSIIRVLDRYSFFIYLVHGIFCTGVFNVYDRVSLPLATLLFFAGTAVGAFVIKKLSESVQKPLLNSLTLA